MRSTGYEQCIVVSGESGAGKTETTKHVIEHVTFVCAENAGDLHERIVKVTYGNGELRGVALTANEHTISETRLLGNFRASVSAIQMLYVPMFRQMPLCVWNVKTVVMHYA